MAKTQTCQVLRVPFCCVCAWGEQMFVRIRWAGRGRPAADACTGAKFRAVQTVHVQGEEAALTLP